MRRTALAFLSLLAVAGTAGCAAGYHHGRDTYGPEADVYYDGFYGPYPGGYWGDGGVFFYSDGHGGYRRDGDGHFRARAFEHGEHFRSGPMPHDH